MKYRHVLSRRTVLRGGAIALGLPFLESMSEKSVLAQTPDVPVGLVSLMHGLGTPDIFLGRGLSGSLQYYKPLIDAGKLSLFTNIDMTAAAADPVVAQHHSGQPYLFSGYRTELAPGFNVVPQGPTLHYSVMQQNYAQGTPTRFRIIDTGIYFRRGINYQFKRIWDDRGANAADFEDLASPVEFFEKVFGTMPNPIQQDAKARAARSILDYLVPAYQKYTGSASNLPPNDIAVLKNHLDRVRQLEQSVYGMATEPPRPVTVQRPTPPDLNYKVDGASCGDPASVYRVAATDFEAAFQLMADLWIAALQADYFRFGNLSFDSGGGHTHFTGAMPHPENASFTFNGNPHANYHAWNPASPEIVSVALGHNHFVHRNQAQVLAKMDSQEFLGPNGKTLLENTLVLVGSEVGTNHDVTRMLHGVAGGNGRFRMGLNTNDRIKAIELYSAIGKTYGLAQVGDGLDYQSDAVAVLT